MEAIHHEKAFSYSFSAEYAVFFARALHQTHLEILPLREVTIRIAHIQAQSLRLSQKTPWKVAPRLKRALRILWIPHPRQTEMRKTRKEATRGR